jgi:monoamine oxidase
MKDKLYDTLIIGGGIAGLTCAYELFKKGLNVKVLEAREKLGGQVKTHRCDTGETLEYGAEWVGKDHVLVRSMCDELDLKLIQHTFPEAAVYRRDMANDTLKALNFEKILSHVSSFTEGYTYEQFKELDKYSWRDFLKKKGLSESEIADVLYAQRSDFLDGTGDLSAGYVAYVNSLGGDTDHLDLRIDGGNDLLPQKIAEYIGLESVHVQSPVQSIEDIENKIYVTCKNGDVFVAPTCVVTVPTSQYKHIEWKPLLSERKINASRNLVYGNLLRVVFEFKEKFFDDEKLCILSEGAGELIYHATESQTCITYGLSAYITAEAALQYDSITNEALTEDLRKILAEIGIQMPEPSKVHKIFWNKRQYQNGGFSLFYPGQWPSIKETLSASEFDNKLFFAGEHTSDLSGFIEGAAQSGVQASKEVLRALVNEGQI